MYIKSLCDGCFKPAGRRLALYGIKDELDCYSESYVKCFWNLCDQHRSNHNIAIKPISKIVIVEPKRQEMPYKTLNAYNDAMAEKFQ